MAAAPAASDTALRRHRILSPSAAVRVSPLCLGTMSLGPSDNPMTGSTDLDTSFAILDEFYNAGGNFVDTSNNYQDGHSEAHIGAWLQARQNRDTIVLATKYSSAFPSPSLSDKFAVHSNSVGNSTKSLHLSVKASLARLQTDYLDLLYIHHWDWQTSIPELMHSLNDLLRQRLVLYLGASDLPAYIVAKANEYARGHGLRGFVVYQGRYSAAHRDLERDVLHLARDDGMAVAAWGVTGSGLLKSAALKQQDAGRTPISSSPHAAALVDVLQAIADAHSAAHPDGPAMLSTSVALAYVRQKAPYVFPVVGARKVAHVRGYVDALRVTLSDAQVAQIEAAAPFDVGFPLSMFGAGPAGSWLVESAGAFDYVERPRAIR